MLHMLTQYGQFLLQTITIILAILLTFAGLVAIASRGGARQKDKITIKQLNERYEAIEDQIKRTTLPKPFYKQQLKLDKKRKKERAKREKEWSPKRVFVINFCGDIRASGVSHLREEVTAILSSAVAQDEVVVVLESPGGLVHAYGLAASQLARIREQNVPLTVAVDKVAASGGYLMACVADKIIAAPFAIIGSIGVIAQIPNFNRLLKQHNIDFEQITSGEFKRTLTLFGENTDSAREKMKQDLGEIHDIFKEFIKQHRQQVDLEQVSTGEHWLATRAKQLNLIDDIITSDDYLYNASKQAEVYQVHYHTKKGLTERLSQAVQTWLGRLGVIGIR